MGRTAGGTVHGGVAGPGRPLCATGPDDAPARRRTGGRRRCVPAVGAVPAAGTLIGPVRDGPAPPAYRRSRHPLRARLPGGFVDGDDSLIRRATAEDRPAILALAVRALGWTGDDRDLAFFRWKHDENPFGVSPAWVATAGGRVVGFRTMLRWELHRGDVVRRMVRAVDTATDPEHRGRGLFRRLTLQALDELSGEGVDAVFNTPNDQSRPGYLAMGWVQLGRPPLSLVPRSPVAVARLARSREPAGKWGEAVDIGTPAAEALGQLDLRALCRAAPRPPAGWATPRTADYLRWRYGFEPLGYRVVEVRGGICVFRVRRRGSAREVAICEWLSPERDPRAVHALVRRCGDYGIGVGLDLRSHGAVPVPRQGPVVTWRAVGDPSVPSLGELALGLGDLELF